MRPCQPLLSTASNTILHKLPPVYTRLHTVRLKKHTHSNIPDYLAGTTKEFFIRIRKTNLQTFYNTEEEISIYLVNRKPTTCCQRGAVLISMDAVCSKQLRPEATRSFNTLRILHHFQRGQSIFGDFYVVAPKNYIIFSCGKE